MAFECRRKNGPEETAGAALAAAWSGVSQRFRVERRRRLRAATPAFRPDVQVVQCEAIPDNRQLTSRHRPRVNANTISRRTLLAQANALRGKCTGQRRHDAFGDLGCSRFGALAGNCGQLHAARGASVVGTDQTKTWAMAM